MYGKEKKVSMHANEEKGLAQVFKQTYSFNMFPIIFWPAN